MKGEKSKNIPDNKNISAVKGKFVTSDIRESCNTKCSKGLLYLEKFEIKKEGNGVMCFKK